MSEQIAAYYDQLAAKHGDTPQAVDAPNQVALDIRYRVIGDVADMNGKRVLEVGCGHGGLGAYLTNRYPGIDYRGIDISTGLLAIGREAHPDLRLYHRDVHDWLSARRFDIVVAQGIFYRLKDVEHAEATIRRLYELAAETCAFTALSRWKHNRSVDELHLDPGDTLLFCRSLTSSIVVRHDYLEGDFATYLHRKDNPK